ncbi:MAG: N-glycosylase [Ruminiclostridium sp.]|nr:N-glycosylase [Ruminiclostridium sp.]
MLTINEPFFSIQIRNFDPFQTFLCGQCFRWAQNQDGLWTGIVFGRRLKLSWENDICTLYGIDQQQFIDQFYDYFDLQTDYFSIKKKLVQMDEKLEKVVAFGSGMRLLRQDLWEVLLSFVISQNNGIPRIKQIVDSLCLHFGKPISVEDDAYDFPQPEALANTTMDNLNLCRGGYRCRYISEISGILVHKPSFLTELKTLPSQQARELLLSLPGIGPKVADCVLLYSGIDRSAFPVDRWIKRVMEELYFHRETSEDTIRKFARDTFGDLAGIAQQYLFYYALNNFGKHADA